MQARFKKLSDFLSSLSISDWGLADILGIHPLSSEYPQALSILISYAPKFETYSEKKYHNLLKTIGRQTDVVTFKISNFLESEGIRHLCIPQGGQDPETLLAMFPHKLAAVRAGLGWIGKSSLLITKKYGPRVRLATLLVDWDLPYNDPVTTSKCGECVVCKTACPYDCIKGTNWHAGILRKDLLDAHVCSAKRETFRHTIGHKHECGLCLLVCPFGNGTSRIKITEDTVNKSLE